MISEVFKKNVKWNIEQASIQFAQAGRVNGRERSGFYKASVMLAASVVEALAFKLLETNNHREMPFDDWTCRESYLLPEQYISDGSRLSICKRAQEKFELKKHTDFKKINEVCYKLNLFSDKFFEDIEKIRTLRNKIHIQGLEYVDRSYTKRELEFISSMIPLLLGKFGLSS
ncbi:MAG: hypothetical protein Q8P72_06165 [Candidatus Roizmanbacteria bacterium]|nr:hypothetical protein [Candidatus Roizmanbacteria bacterium]